jgi:hypothetical protein
MTLANPVGKHNHIISVLGLGWDTRVAEDLSAKVGVSNLADIVNVEAIATDFAGGVVECGHSFPFVDVLIIAGG